MAGNTGNANTAIGFNSLANNTIGTNNTTLGINTLFNNTTGHNNTAVGVNALFNNIGGLQNTAVGVNTLLNSTGNNNTVVGYNSAQNLTTGANNTILGANVTGLSATLSNTIIIADGNGNQRIYVDSNGNTALGTTTPILGNNAATLPTLTVSGTGLITSSSTLANTDSMLQIDNTSALPNTQSAFTATLRTSQLLGNGDVSRFGMFHLRHSAGSNWQGTTYRLQKVVSTPTNAVQGFIDFGINGIAGDTGLGFGANGNTQMVLNGSGNVGIGITTPGAPLDVNGNALVRGWLGIGGIAPTQALDVNGTINVRGQGIRYSGSSGANFMALRWDSPNFVGLVDNAVAIILGTASDYRLKKNITDYTSSLDALMKLRPVQYLPKECTDCDEDDIIVGFLAHELEETFPSLVQGEKDAVNEEGEPYYQSVHYAGLTPILVRAVQELKEENEKLNTENDALKKQIADILKRLEALEN